MQKRKTTANYRHTESLYYFYFVGQGLTADTHAQKPSEKEIKEKEELPLLRRGQGRSCPVGTSSPTLNVDEHFPDTSAFNARPLRLLASHLNVHERFFRRALSTHVLSDSMSRIRLSVGGATFSPPQYLKHLFEIPS